MKSLSLRPLTPLWKSKRLRTNCLTISLTLRCNMSEERIHIGDEVRLEGVNRHGKNRVRENGDWWEVIMVDGGDSSILNTKVCVTPVSGTGNWRWIDLPEDRDMRIVEHVS